MVTEITEAQLLKSRRPGVAIDREMSGVGIADLENIGAGVTEFSKHLAGVGGSIHIPNSGSIASAFMELDMLQVGECIRYPATEWILLRLHNRLSFCKPIEKRKL